MTEREKLTVVEEEVQRRIEATHGVVKRISAERRRQDSLVLRGKFPWNCAFDGPSYADKLAVLMEETGEVAREVTEHLISTGKYAADKALLVMPPHREEFYRARLAEELVQVAAVCTAWIEHLTGCESGAQTELERRSEESKP
jgi:NTP pyrophosphatase (non-canonical NTP hydrolase)